MNDYSQDNDEFEAGRRTEGKEYDVRCPKCESALEELRNSKSYVELISIFDCGDFSYGEETNEYEDMIAIRCTNSSCGWVLTDKEGNPITETDKVLEWAKEREDPIDE